NLAGEGREGYPRSRCTRTGWPAAPGRPGSETPERREYNDKMDAIYLGVYLGVLLAVSVAVVSLSYVWFSALCGARRAGAPAAGAAGPPPAADLKKRESLGYLRAAGPWDRPRTSKEFTAVTDQPPRRSVLIVEDHPELRRSLTDLLQEAGYAVTSAADGQEAL